MTYSPQQLLSDLSFLHKCFNERHLWKDERRKQIARKAIWFIYCNTVPSNTEEMKSLQETCESHLRELI